MEINTPIKKIKIIYKKKSKSSPSKKKEAES